MLPAILAGKDPLKTLLRPSESSPMIRVDFVCQQNRPIFLCRVCLLAFFSRPQPLAGFNLPSDAKHSSVVPSAVQNKDREPCLQSKIASYMLMRVVYT